MKLGVWGSGELGKLACGIHDILWQNRFRFVKISAMNKLHRIISAFAPAILVILLLCGFSHVRLIDIQTAIIQEDYSMAESLAQEYIQTKPAQEHLHEALYYLGLSRLRLAHYPQARETFQQLQSVTVKGTLYDKASIGLVDTFLFNEHYPEALAEAKKILSKSPHSEFLSLIYLKIARANLKLANWKEAQHYLRKITNEFPESLEAHTARQLLEEKQYFAVQIGAFLDRKLAERLTDELKDKGEYAYIVETTDKDGVQFFRVRVGKFASLKEAIDLKSRLSKLGYPTSIYP